MSSAPALSAAIPEPLEQGSSLWHDAWLRLRKNKLAVFGMIALTIIALACVIGPWISPYGYEQQNLDNTYSPPSAAHWLGTDQLGRDLLVRLLFGGRVSLGVGLAATFVALTIGVVYGAVAGFSDDRLNVKRGFLLFAALIGAATWFGAILHHMSGLKLTGWPWFLAIGQAVISTPLTALIGAIAGGLFGGVLGLLRVKLDALMMRAVDIMYSLPFPIFVILLMVLFGRDIYLLFFAIGAVEWLTMARIVRSQVMAVKKMEFIEAARSLGFGRRRLIFRHILPNILGPIIVYTTLTIPAVMLLEAFLSFLGLGVQPPMSSWGVLIKDGAEKMEEYSWLLLFPAVLFSTTLLSLNFLGDGLRDALDVRSSKD